MIAASPGPLGRSGLAVVALAVVSIAGAMAAIDARGQDKAAEKGWIALFNGKDLDGWTPKIKGYAAGEMKHGPIALIDDNVPVIVLAPSGPLFEKTVSNMQEVRARGGKIVLISDGKGVAEAGEGCIATIEMPQVHPLIAPLVYAVPVQLLAYHVAVLKGTDVDQPRNLAKSVTVE